MHHTRIILVSTIAALALVGAGCAKKQTAAPGGATSPSAAGAPNDTSDVPVSVNDTQGTVTIKDTAAPEEKGLRVYESKKYGFKVKLPEDIPVKVDETGSFKWAGTNYNVVEIQIEDKKSKGSYNGVVSFEIAQNPEKLPLKQWLTKYNTQNDTFDTKPKKFGENITGLSIVYPPNYQKGLGDLSFPPSPVIFADSSNSMVFFIEYGQEPLIPADYGLTYNALGDMIEKTFQFTTN